MARRSITLLLAAALLLPVVVCVVVAAARVLAAMDDHAGAAVLDRVALGCGMVWIVVLVALVLVQAAAALLERPSGRGDRDEPPDTL
jgi:hypothetical protein